MINSRLRSIVIVTTLAGLSCKTRDQGSQAQSASSTTPATQVAAVQAYRATIGAYLQQNSVAQGWEWFMHHSHGFAGTPMILVKMLPELDPTIWGSPEDKFARFGHFVLPGDEGRALPSSLGMTAFPTRTDNNAIMVTTETCGTCHTGRVRISGANGDEILFLYGGVNTQFDIRMWRTALEQTVTSYLSNDADLKNTAKRLRTLVASKPSGFFLPNQDDDARQRGFLLAAGGAEKMLNDLVKLTAGFTEGKRKQRATTYAPRSTSNPPNIDSGHPGQVDASGDLLAQRLPTTIGMPAKPSLTDIPSVWLQNEYSVGQWDGTLSNQFIRNLAAQIAVAPGTTVDRRVANFALQFITDLPAPKFPFTSKTPDRQAALVAKGQALFASNCADCHKALNTRTYSQVNTDMNRANVMTKSGTLLIAKIFFDACEDKMPDGSTGPSCGNFTKYFRSPDPVSGPGYAGKPLTGVWARAPYLHNGSVPTLRHLLLPSTRPARFVLGSLGYDADNLGFNWNLDNLDEYRKLDPRVSIQDTSQNGLGNRGHDQAKLILADKIYRLDWTPRQDDDPESVDALLEYLKTL